MAPFAARWIYGRGVPHITAGFIYHRQARAARQQQPVAAVCSNCMLPAAILLQSCSSLNRQVSCCQPCHVRACSRLFALELALKQTGSESAKRAADVAQRAAMTEGSNAGIIKVCAGISVGCFFLQRHLSNPPGLHMH